MACALTHQVAVLGTSAGHLVVCDLDLKQMSTVEHQECILCMEYSDQYLFVGFTSGTVRVYLVEGFELKEVVGLNVHDFGVNCMS